jgi:DNA invertase Pin-like site-specific DNA recombinase
MRVALYARVSTDDRGQDPQNQLTQLRSFAASQGWEVCMEYADEATGRKGDRVAFNRMWQDAERHKFDCLLFWSLDRLTREGPFQTLLYLRQLSDMGVKFKSYTEQYVDTLGVFGEAIIGLLAAIAKQESIRMSERIRAGLQRARAKGKHIGRPSADVDMIAVSARRASGESLRSIARGLGVSPALLVKRAKAGAL